MVISGLYVKIRKSPFKTHVYIAHPAQLFDYICISQEFKKLVVILFTAVRFQLKISLYHNEMTPLFSKGHGGVITCLWPRLLGPIQLVTDLLANLT